MNKVSSLRETPNGARFRDALYAEEKTSNLRFVTALDGSKILQQVVKCTWTFENEDNPNYTEVVSCHEWRNVEEVSFKGEDYYD